MTQTQQQQVEGISTSSFFEASDLAIEATGDAGTVQIKRISSGAVLGTVSRTENSPATVEVYDGKGGLAAIVTSTNDTKYFGLPGSEIEVEGMAVKLDGEKIPTSDVPAAVKRGPVKPQSVTPHAVILGAGLATRFEPVSGDNTRSSKPAIPLLGDKSVIRLIAERLAECGFTDIFINTFYKRESLKKGLEDLDGVNIFYLDEPEPSGTAGGLRQIFDKPEKFPGYFSPDKPILVLQGDAITDVDLTALMDAHVKNNAAVTIGCMVKPDEDVDKFGIVATDQSGPDGKSGRIKMFLEKPSLDEAGPHRLANTGFYIFSPEAFPVIREAYDLKMADPSVERNSKGEVVLDFAMHVFPEVLRKVNQGEIKDSQGEIKPFWAQVVDGYWSDIGNPSQYIQSVRDLYAGKANVALPENPEEFLDEDGIVYWPGAKERAKSEKALLSGNVVVALPFKSG